MKTRPNEPCPCGSGAKFKRCCGAGDSHHPSRPCHNADRVWMERHVIGEGDILLYGNLQHELEGASPETVWRELRKAAESYLGGGKLRTQALHARIDDTIASLIARDVRFGYPPPFCHKGCSNCCHELVYCTPEEAAGIHDYCRQHGLTIDYAKLARQLDHVDFDSHGNHTGSTTWNDQVREDQSCVFLSKADQGCTIWPVRPSVCRAHLAEGTDQFCAPHNGVENPEARGIDYVEVDYILSAVFTIHRDAIKRTMGRLLLDLMPDE